MSCRRQRSIPLGGRYRQVSLYHNTHWKETNIASGNGLVPKTLAEALLTNFYDLSLGTNRATEIIGHVFWYGKSFIFWCRVKWEKGQRIAVAPNERQDFPIHLHFDCVNSRFPGCIKGIIKAPHYWAFLAKSTGYRRFSSQGVYYVERVSMPWCHHRQKEPKSYMKSTLIDNNSCHRCRGKWGQCEGICCTGIHITESV